MSDPPLRFGAPEPGLDYRERPAAYGLLEREGRLALVYVTLSDRPPFYDLPGGGVDPGEDEQQALRREFGEETGLLVSAGKRLAAAEQYMISAHNEPFLSQGGFFEAILEGDRPALKIERDHELVWMPPAEALVKLRHDSHAWAVAAWLRSRGHRPGSAAACRSAPRVRSLRSSAG